MRNSSEYLALQELIRRSPGRKLLPERELARSLQISRPRLRLCLSRLQAEGLIQRRQGSGTYAVDPETAALASVLLLVDGRLKLAEDPFFSCAVEQLQHAMQAHGIRCILHRFSSGHRPALAEDGLITLGLTGQEVARDLTRHSPPMVGLFIKQARIPPVARVSLLDLDDAAAAARAVQHLARIGCRRIIFVGHNCLPVSESRLAGVTQAAAQLRLGVQVIATGMNYLEGLQAGRRLTPPHNAGIIAANDWLAVGLRAGLSLNPRFAAAHLPLCSFDGLPIAADPALQITSFRVPLADLAMDAIAELQRLAASPTATGRTITYQLLPPVTECAPNPGR